jgi:hypothetical protein
MFELKVIPHAEITTETLNEIIRIKSVAWSYSHSEHMDWINNNLKNTDFHVLLQKENKAVAYLNLVTIEITIDKVNHQAIGIGNVCSLEKGKGYGKELMKLTTHYVLQNNKIGLLFCKKKLMGFYRKHGWKPMERKQLNVTFESFNIETMITNYKHNFSHLRYDGRAF